MLVASGPFRLPLALFRGGLSADVVVSYRVRDGREGEALRYDPRNRETSPWPLQGVVPFKRMAGPATFARLPPLGTAPILRSEFVGRLVPSGFRVGSGGASPSAWRFQEHGLVSMLADLRFSMPEQSLPRVAWSLGNPSSDDCAPLAASAVRQGSPRTPRLVFRHCLRASLPPRSGCAFPCSFRGLFLIPAHFKSSRQLIADLFNGHAFGPPGGFTRPSPWPTVDH